MDGFIFTGGVFFAFLAEVQKKVELSSSVIVLGEGTREVDLFVGLNRIIRFDYTPKESTVKTYASEYKTCKEVNHKFPLCNAEDFYSFEKDIKENPAKPLNSMRQFIKKYINEDKADRLVSMVLKAIELDSSYKSPEFYVSSDLKDFFTKEVLLKQREFQLSSFLLGILYYAIKRAPTDNCKGAAMYNYFFKASQPDLNRIYLCAPELIRITKERIGGQPDLVNVAKGTAEELIIEKYLNKLSDKYSSIKTLLYADDPQPFYDFFVCNDVLLEQSTITFGIRKRDTLPISNLGAQNLRSYNRYMVLTGSGGLGKSMMLRHLLLDSIANYEELLRVPFYVQLKDFSSGYVDFTDYLSKQISSLCDLDRDGIVSILIQNRALILLDGFDEMKTEYLDIFFGYFDRFVDLYDSNIFVITSRPGYSFINFNRFSIAKLQPFKKNQAIELINRLIFRPDDPSIKEKFKEQLEKSLWYSHRAFAENPLLLTIMLMTFANYADVPAQMHIFYREAYETLAQRHDASKGAYKREFRTKLTSSRFSVYLAEFCGRTYVDEKYKLTEEEFTSVFDNLNERNTDEGKKESIQVDDFKFDLTVNLCLMIKDGIEYSFTHRSFQEYFCALCFSTLPDRKLNSVGAFFENAKHRAYGDHTFDMLYALIPNKVEEYIFLPFLETLVKKCEAGDGYWTFLQIMYPTIYMEEGDTNSYTNNDSSSFLFNFMATKHSFKGYVCEDFLCDERFLTNEYVMVFTENKSWETCEYEEAVSSYSSDEIDDTIVGRSYEVPVKYIVQHKDEFQDVIEEMESDYFTLKEEYQGALEYYIELKDKCEKSINSASLFD